MGPRAAFSRAAAVLGTRRSQAREKREGGGGPKGCPTKEGVSPQLPPPEARGPFRSEPQKGPPGSTHHDLRECLQRGLELVGGREGVWEVHGPGQDEQGRGDLLMQVQLQPLQSKVQDTDSPTGLVPFASPGTQSPGGGSFRNRPAYAGPTDGRAFDHAPASAAPSDDPP